MKLRELFESLIADFPIANVKRSNGAIGTQGVVTSQVADVLTHVCGLTVNSNATMRELVETFKASKEAQEKLIAFLKDHPAHVSRLPDDTYHLEDGHHRIFLLDQAGYKTVSAEVKD